MAAFDLRNNEQSGQQLRGLSGGSVRWVYLDDANSFYNFRLREHYTDDDLSEHPERIWQASDHPDAEGLRSHIADALTAGERFSDVLLILSADDYDVLSEDDASFKDRLTAVIRDNYAEFLAKSAVGAQSRPLGVWIVRDGSDEVGGMDRSLLEGQFITGVLPNLYRGTGPRSHAIIGLHVNIPGYWEGYREVGHLHDDQTLFTLGSSWLDNFSHPSLRESALYGLQRDDDGAFFHVINPDLGDRYQITTTDQGGVSVITLATRDGVPLAYIVLAVIEQDEEELLAGLGGRSSEPEPSLQPTPLGDHRPLALDAADAPPLEPASVPMNVSSRGPGSRTIIPEAQNERIFTLQERGALLQKVHFSAFMLGYDVYLGHRGELGTVVDQPAATFQVRKKTVSLLANADNVVMDGEPIPQGESRLIEGDAVIQVGNQRLEYRELRHIELEGWPYVGEIRRPPSSTYMLWGREYTIGRSRDCRVVLPDEPRNDNIVWKPKVSDGVTIKSKTGEIPKSRFYTDSIMVASEHAAIELLGDMPELSCHARHCYTFIRRGGEVLSLLPTTDGDAAHKVPLVPGDEVLVGNCVFHISFATSDESTVAPAPAPRVSSDSLVDAVSTPEQESAYDDLDEPAPVSFGLPEPALGNLPDVSAEEPEPVLPPRVEPAAEAALAAAQRSWPEALDDAMADASDSPPVPRAAAPRPPTHAPAPAPVPPPPAPAPVDDGEQHVVFVDDQDAQFELGRPARLVQVGWAVNGHVTCGNHTGADLVIPENRIESDQVFEARTYFALRIRGKRGKLEGVDVDEVRVDGEPASSAYESVDGLVISVLRRDDEGEEDFTVDLSVVEDPALPDPRARLVSIDTDEPLAVALITRGFPVRAPRELELNGLGITGTFDGTGLILSEYLAGYRSSAGFRPFFVQTDGGRFVTAPEDGSPIELSPGDRIVIDGAVFRFDVT